MSQQGYACASASLILLAGLTGAGTITTIPPLLDQNGEAQVWVTVVLASSFLVLAVAAERLRRKLDTPSP